MNETERFMARYGDPKGWRRAWETLGLVASLGHYFWCRWTHGRTHIGRPVTYVDGQRRLAPWCTRCQTWA